MSQMRRFPADDWSSKNIVKDEQQQDRTLTELMNAVPDYGITQEALKKFISKFETVPDCKTKSGYELAKAGIAEMVNKRNRVKDRTAELSRALNSKKKEIQAGGEEIQNMITEVESRWKLERKTVDDEKARLKKEKEEKAAEWRAKQQGVIDQIKNLSMVSYGESIENIEVRLDTLSSIEIVESFFDPKTDYYINARAEKETCRVLLERILDTEKLKKAEAEEEQRKKEEAAEELRIQTEKLEAQKAAFEEEKREREAKEKVEREEQRKRDEKREAEEKAREAERREIQLDTERKLEAERKKIEDEKAQIEKEKLDREAIKRAKIEADERARAAEEKKKANRELQKKNAGEIVDALNEFTPGSDASKMLASLLMTNKIPHVKYIG